MDYYFEHVGLATRLRFLSRRWIPYHQRWKKHHGIPPLCRWKPSCSPSSQLHRVVAWKHGTWISNSSCFRRPGWLASQTRCLCCKSTNSEEKFKETVKYKVASLSKSAHELPCLLQVSISCNLPCFSSSQFWLCRTSKRLPWHCW